MVYLEKLVVTENLIKKEYGFESKESTWITANDRYKWKNYKKIVHQLRLGTLYFIIFGEETLEQLTRQAT